MKHYLLSLCAATLMFSCSKSDQMPTDDGADGKMHFAANIPDKEDDWNRASRGEVINDANISDFGTFCFHTDRSLWEEVSSPATPNKMCNVKVERTADTDQWTYTPAVEWDGGDLSFFTFFGYAPYATTANGITAPESDAATGTPVLGFVVGDDVPTQVDLLVSKPVYNTVPVATVRMQFAHALSCIGFKAYSQVPKVTVSKIQITGVKYQGNLTLDGGWSSAADTKDFTITYSTPIELSDDAKNLETATDLSPGSNGFFLLPQVLTDNTSAKIIFTFTTGGAVLTKEYVIKEAWEQSKRIIYTVDLTATLEEPLQVTKVTITDWGLGGKTEGEGNGVASEVKLTYNDGGTETVEGPVIQNGELLISMRPANPIEAWNTKPDGSGEYYGQGDVIIMTKNTTLYNVDNTVTIGGMRWLRGNLSGTAGSANGYYAESNPSKPGMIFKWGDEWVYECATNTSDGMIGGNTYNASTTPSDTSTQLGYDYVGLEGGRSSGDPCKHLGEEFMTPTSAQYQTLILAGDAVSSYHGVAGHFLGAKSAECTDTKIAEGCIFMPYVGYRSYSNGALEEKTTGYYWTATIASSINAQRFQITNSGTSATRQGNRGFGLSVRCVSTDVKINDTYWTTTNLEGRAGTPTGHRMVGEPEYGGNFFKWGDMWVYTREAIPNDGMVGDATVNASTTPAASLTGGTGYDYVDLEGGRASGDPCQMLGKNYKTPTAAQYAIPKSQRSWGSYHNSTGIFLGPDAKKCTNDKIAAGCIFLPAAGGRWHDDGALAMDNSRHLYWTSSVSTPTTGMSLYTTSAYWETISLARAYGRSVRCVRDATIK